MSVFFVGKVGLDSCSPILQYTTHCTASHFTHMSEVRSEVRSDVRLNIATAALLATAKGVGGLDGITYAAEALIDASQHLQGPRADVQSLVQAVCEVTDAESQLFVDVVAAVLGIIAISPDAPDIMTPLTPAWSLFIYFDHLTCAAREFSTKLKDEDDGIGIDIDLLLKLDSQVQAAEKKVLGWKLLVEPVIAELLHAVNSTIVL